jgi:hypothetical protein
MRSIRIGVTLNTTFQHISAPVENIENITSNSRIVNLINESLSVASNSTTLNQNSVSRKSNTDLEEMDLRK